MYSHQIHRTIHGWDRFACQKQERCWWWWFTHANTFGPVTDFVICKFLKRIWRLSWHPMYLLILFVIKLIQLNLTYIAYEIWCEFCIFPGCPGDINLSTYDLNCIASTLKKYLRELPHPVIPEEQYNSFMDAASKICLHKPIHTHTKPWGKIKVARFTADFCLAWCLIWWFAREEKYGHMWHRMALLRHALTPW